MRVICLSLYKKTVALGSTDYLVQNQRDSI